MKSIKAIFVALLAITACFSQTVNISGKVINAYSGAPLSGASVILEKAGIATTATEDGSFTITDIGINSPLKQSLPHTVSARIHNGLVYIRAFERVELAIIAYSLQGRAICRTREIMEAGTHAVALPQIGASMYLYKIKFGNSEILLKSPTLNRQFKGATSSIQSSSPAAAAKRVQGAAAINDVIMAKKEGFLNYRVVLSNSDTSGIEIAMIVCTDTVKDADGNVYQAVKIGSQVWTVENLRTTKFDNGQSIPLQTNGSQWTAMTTPAYSYYDNTSDDAARSKYGALYNWYAVDSKLQLKTLAPAGWHIPNIAEWNVLKSYLVDNGYNWDGTASGSKISKCLADKADWKADTLGGTIGNDLTKNNSTGFSALPGGDRYLGGVFSGMGSSGSWWTATGSDATHAYGFYLECSSDELYGGNVSKSWGCSVRLIMD